MSNSTIQRSLQGGLQQLGVTLIGLFTAMMLGCGGSDSSDTSGSNTVAQADSGSASSGYEEAYGGPGGGQEAASGGPSGSSGSGYGGEEESEQQYGGGGYGGGPSGASSSDMSGYGEDYMAQSGYGQGGEEESESQYGSGGYGAGPSGTSSGMSGYGEDYMAQSGYGSASGGGPGMGPNSGYGEDMEDGGYGGYDGGYGGQGYGMGGPGMSPPGMGGPGMGGPGMGGQGGQFQMVKTFLNQNCVSCHGPRQPKAGLRLDTLNPNLTAPSAQPVWTKVLGQLSSGTMPPASAPQPNPNQKQLVIDFLRNTLGEDAVGAEVNFLTQAERAFGSGEEESAIQLMYAHALVSEDAESDVLSKVRWYPAGKRPALTVRFAVGVSLEAPSTLTDVKPIGSSQFGGGGGGGMGPGGMGGYGGPGGGQQGAERTFQDLTGEFGDQLVAAFQTRWVEGKFGPAFAEVTKTAPAAGNNARGMGGRGMGGPGMGPGMGGGYGGGYDGEEGYGGYGGYGGGTSNNSETAATGATRPDQSIMPGLLYLGEGDQTELIEKATEADVDALFIFDVEAKQNMRTRMVNNDTRLRLVRINGEPNGEPITATQSLSNTEIERSRLRGNYNDELEKNIDRLFSRVDENLQLVNLPNMETRHAHMRMIQLLSDSQVDPMQKLFEARLFHAMSLLDDEELSKCYQIALQGNEGISLATGTEEDRRLVLSETKVLEGVN